MWKAGVVLDDAQSSVGYTQFTRNDASPSGGADPGNAWPWVCPDGAPAPDAGCPVPAGPVASDAGGDAAG